MADLCVLWVSMFERPKYTKQKAIRQLHVQRKGVRRQHKSSSSVCFGSAHIRSALGNDILFHTSAVFTYAIRRYVIIIMLLDNK
jgi:hypothetical protein